MQVPSLLGYIPQNDDYYQHERRGKLRVYLPLQNHHRILHDFSQSAVLVFAERIQELCCISPQCGERLNLILYFIRLLSDLYLYVPIDNMKKGVNELLWVLVVILVVVWCQ